MDEIFNQIPAAESKTWVPAVEMPYWHSDHLRYRIQFCSGHFIGHLAEGGNRRNWVKWENPQETPCDVSGCVEMAVKREGRVVPAWKEGD